MVEKGDWRITLDVFKCKPWWWLWGLIINWRITLDVFKFNIGPIAAAKRPNWRITLDVFKLNINFLNIGTNFIEE